MKRYDIHPDFLKYQKMPMPLNIVALPIVNFLMTRMLNHARIKEGLTRQQYLVKGYRGKNVRLFVFSPSAQSKLPPALVYFHGGGFAIQAAPHHTRLAMEYAIQTSCKVIFVDYHLLPKATFPAGLEDCFAAYRWVRQQADRLDIDDSRIAVGGDSAGATLAAGVCLLAKDRQVSLPCFQMLIYPVTDERQSTPSMQKYTDTPLWNSRLNAKMWKMYLKNGAMGKKGYASPAEASSLAGMPPSYIEVAEYDCLHDEGITFANLLKDNGVSVTLKETKRTVHGFEIATNNNIIRDAIAFRVAELRKAFG